MIQYIRVGISLLVALIWGLASVSVSAQTCRFHISGKIVNAETREPMPFATVLIKENAVGVVADEQGRYEIRDLCAGTYTLVCSHVSCDHAEHRIVLESHTDSLDFSLHEHSIGLADVLVRAKAPALRSIQPVAEVKGGKLEALQSLNMAEAARRIPGVSVLNTGATIAKPVIQGLHSNRILVLNNGVQLEGHQWGVEHAPEVDPYLAEKITVIKGASSVRYGPEALGGVILVEPRELPRQRGIGGALTLSGLSNGRTGAASGFLEAATGGKWGLSGRLQGTLKRGGNLRTPDYFLNNTGVLERHVSWALGLHRDRWHTELFYANFYSRLGIFRDAHIGNITDIENAIERGRPLQDGEFTYELGRPQQRILHELLKWRTDYRFDEGSKLALQLSRQFNRRQEFDAHRLYGPAPTGFDDPDMEFELTTYTAGLDWEKLLFKRLRNQLGINYMGQRNTTDRGGLIPNYTAQIGGAYWIARWQASDSPWQFEGGARYDVKAMEVELPASDSLPTDFSFSSASGTLGFIYQIAGLAQLRFQTASAWRAPNINELYSDGVHHGAASYEKGDTDLQPERALNTSLSLEWIRQGKLTATLSVYYNRISDFIFLIPQAEYILSIRGPFPAFQYTQTDARLMGLDWNAGFELSDRWSVNSLVSLLRARDHIGDQPLIFMPADRFEHGVTYRLKPLREGDEAPFVNLTMVNVSRQSRAPEGLDYAPPPPGHTRFNLEAGMRWYWGRQPIDVGLAVFNLTNTRYREYLNRFRYYAHEVGRNVTFRIKVPLGTAARG